jgi:hypothetical protein
MSSNRSAAYVVSLNLRRRHLDESQRALVAARLATLPRGANQHASIGAPSQERAAGLLNVSRSGVQRAREILDEGAPEPIEAVERGRISVSAGAITGVAAVYQRHEFLSERREALDQWGAHLGENLNGGVLTGEDVDPRIASSIVA